MVSTPSFIGDDTPASRELLMHWVYWRDCSMDAFQLVTT